MYIDVIPTSMENPNEQIYLVVNGNNNNIALDTAYG